MQNFLKLRGMLRTLGGKLGAHRAHGGSACSCSDPARPRVEFWFPELTESPRQWTYLRSPPRQSPLPRSCLGDVPVPPRHPTDPAQLSVVFQFKMLSEPPRHPPRHAPNLQSRLRALRGNCPLTQSARLEVTKLPELPLFYILFVKIKLRAFM